MAWLSLTVGAGALIGIAVWPERLFAFVWIAPLLLITGLQALAKRQALLISAIAAGSWRAVWLLALAGAMEYQKPGALGVCGAL